MMAAMVSNSPMHCHVGPFKSVEAVMPAPWVWEVQIPAVLWTEYGLVPNAAIVAPKFHHGEISTCWNCRGEGECQFPKRGIEFQRSL